MFLRPPGLFIPRSPYDAPSAGASPSAAYTNFQARASLTGSDATNYQTLLDGLTTDGFFDGSGNSTLLDFFYILAAPSSTVALLNLVQNAYNPTANGSPTFTAYQGYNGVDGSTTVYLDTGFNPTSGSPNYTQNSAHISIWSNTNATPASGARDIGFDGSITGQACAHIISKSSANTTNYRINDDRVGQSGGIANTDATGFYVASRSGSSAQKGYRNNVDQSVGSVASGTLVSGNFYILALNTVGTGANSGSANQLCFASIGANLTATQVGQIYSRVGTYRTAVGL